MADFVDELTARVPQLAECAGSVRRAFDALLECYRSGGKVLTCGNGGSAADAEHIVGELMKSFRLRRALPADVEEKLPPEMAEKLEGALPAVSLVSMSGILTAFANDVDWETAFAQQVLGLGCPGDVLIALSTSGNSANCVAAAQVAHAKGMKDVAICVPETETYLVQELHLPVYHALCAAVEASVFGSEAS